MELSIVSVTVAQRLCETIYRSCIAHMIGATTQGANQHTPSNHVTKIRLQVC